MYLTDVYATVIKHTKVRLKKRKTWSVFTINFYIEYKGMHMDKEIVWSTRFRSIGTLCKFIWRAEIFASVI
jgi:hypothetical protein